MIRLGADFDALRNTKSARSAGQIVTVQSCPHAERGREDHAVANSANISCHSTSILFYEIPKGSPLFSTGSHYHRGA